MFLKINKFYKINNNLKKNLENRQINHFSKYEMKGQNERKIPPYFHFKILSQ